MNTIKEEFVYFIKKENCIFLDLLQTLKQLFSKITVLKNKSQLIPLLKYL